MTLPMSSRATKSFAWLWIAALSTATVGVSVHQIYCYCQGKSVVSLFSIQNACAAEERRDVSDCCRQQASPTPHSCCEREKKSCDGEQNGCMEKSTKVFQLKAEYVVDHPFEKTFDCPLWIEKMPMFRRYFRPAICETIFTDKSPPPPSLSGRDICLRLQTFRC